MRMDPPPPPHTVHPCRCSARGLLRLLLVLALPMTSHATEEPDYQVVCTIADFEIRQYQPYTVAEVVVDGEASEAGNLAFPVLAAYIFGKNKGARTLAMTAPVTQTPAAVTLKMTAPVTQTAAAGGFRVQFVLPAGTTPANAPEPLDARITLRAVAPSRVAVIRFSGFWSDANYAQHLDTLQTAVRATDLTPVGDPVYARYNPPFTPWFLRRNEI